ncbi:MAG: beta-Ala-His dipeptidase [Candidatus Hermodarchaeota archaeon]
MENLKELGAPQEFWDYMFQISKIPRCSEHEEHIRNFIIKEATAMGFETKLDTVGNLVVKIPNRESPSKDNLNIILQAHMDMVCEKNEDIRHDFSKDPLSLKIIEINNEKWLAAEGTTLGADNGVGLAYNLAIMKKLHEGSLDLGSIDLELLFTVDEEQGLTGASKLDKNLIKGKYLLNLDSEDENKFTIGCAGGKVFTVEVKYDNFNLSENQTQIIPIRIDISGLQGGHSGTDINKQRGNAIIILNEVLWKLNAKYNIYVESVEGGNKSNAIPREAHAILYIDKSQFDEIKLFTNDLYHNFKKLYAGSDSNLNMAIDLVDSPNKVNLFSRDFQQALLDFLYILPNGPVSLHPTKKGLVHTSLNLGSIHTLEDKIKLQISTRSLSDYDKELLFEKIETLLKLSQLDINIIIDTVYPSWPPNFDSELVKKVKEVYSKIFNEEAVIRAIHAGLECAYFSYYYPKMEMISLGPIIIGNHSPDERLKIASAKKVWKFLIELLRHLNED